MFQKTVLAAVFPHAWVLFFQSVDIVMKISVVKDMHSGIPERWQRRYKIYRFAYR